MRSNRLECLREPRRVAVPWGRAPEGARGRGEGGGHRPEGERGAEGAGPPAGEGEAEGAATGPSAIGFLS